jgi:hypothetical protein
MNRFTIRRSAALLLALTLLLLCGCSPARLVPESVTYSAPEEVLQQFEEEVDAEVLAAIEEGKTALLWRISPTEELAGTAALRQYTLLDCAALWEDLQAAIFPDAQVLTDEMLREGRARAITLSDDAGTYSAEISTGSISITCASAEDAQERAEEIVALLEEKSGCQLESCEPETEGGELVKYAYVVDGIRVDAKLYGSELSMGAAVCVQEGGFISIVSPFALGQSVEQYDLAQYLTMAEASRLCQLQWTNDNFPLVCAIDDYALFYTLDAENGLLRPAWQFIGNFYTISSGFSHVTDVVLDGVTGAIVRWG